MSKPQDYDPGDNFSRRVPCGDDRERLVCDTCDFVAYENPKMVVGSVVTWEDRVLLVKRAIEPRLGYWTLPAGFMELNETVEEGAKREAWEEARARVSFDQVLAIYSIPRISQTQVIYRGVLTDPAVEPGPESQEVGLFSWDEIPWEDLAFPTVHWALRQFDRVREQKGFAPFGNEEDGSS
ncbi:NUDIX hydrolase [Kiloniella sp. b19]|uniref:NUDIX hydrolase n=1 Tax=Kiloniella sp. GXU_MW_B19 TaxID=3141326 RepID=UPI0031D28C88